MWPKSPKFLGRTLSIQFYWDRKVIMLLLISAPGLTTGWTLPLKVSWILGVTSRLDSRGLIGRRGPDRLSGIRPKPGRRAVRIPACEAWAGRRAGAEPIGPRRPFRRAARSPEAEGPPRTASPGLAHPTLADDEDLQSGQHVLVHPASTLLGHNPRPRQHSPAAAKTACACAPPWPPPPSPTGCLGGEATDRPVPPRGSSASARSLERRRFPGGSYVVQEQMGRAACKSACLLPGTGSAPALTPPASSFVLGGLDITSSSSEQLLRWAKLGALRWTVLDGGTALWHCWASSTLSPHQGQHF